MSPEELAEIEASNATADTSLGWVAWANMIITSLIEELREKS